MRYTRNAITQFQSKLQGAQRLSIKYVSKEVVEFSSLFCLYFLHFLWNEESENRHKIVYSDRLL